MEQELVEEKNQLEEITDKLGETLTLENDEDEDYEDYDDDDDDDDDDEIDDGDFEFSFDGGEIKSPVSAEEVFINGQIRTTVPFSVGDAVKSSETPSVRKVFVVSENEDVVEGPYCVWSTEEDSISSENQAVMPEMSKKSNSTGFSRLRKMKELLVRSNSDGKDTFVFLTGKSKKNAFVETSGEIPEVSMKEKKKGKKKKDETSGISSGGEIPDISTEVEKKEKKKGKKPSMTAAYEALYGGGKKEKKSYLPYRVGFFTNVNSMTKNVHPY